jgi:hypothetical protein
MSVGALWLPIKGCPTGGEDDGDWTVRWRRRSSSHASVRRHTANLLWPSCSKPVIVQNYC